MAPTYGELKALFKNAKNLDRKEMRKHNIDIILASTAIQTNSVLIRYGQNLSGYCEIKSELSF